MAKNDDNLMNMLPHLLGLLTNWIGPLIMFLVLRNEKSNALENAKHALNFQISLMIYMAISFALIIILIGFVLIWALGLFALIVGIIAIIRSYQGEVYTYPLEIKFLK